MPLANAPACPIRPPRSAGALRLCQWLALLAWLPFATTVGATMRYVHPAPDVNVDPQHDYYMTMLRAALEITRSADGPYEILAHPGTMNAERAALMLAQGEGINVMVRTTSQDRETRLLPVRIPLDKGLIGYRVFLIRPATQYRLHRVHQTDELARFSIGQGSGWQDTQILRAAGLRVEVGPGFGSLLGMLAAGRFDLFARGVNEVAYELRLARAQYPDLALERRLLLHYPMPRYFFFARDAQGERLARRVERGLELLLRSGEFERRYRGYKAEVLRDVPLAGRRVLRLNNPFLPTATPLHRKELWDSLDSELHGAAGS